MHIYLPNPRRIILFAAILPLITLGSSAQLAQPAAEYTVTDLRPDLCCDNVFATGVNDAGWVTGYTYPSVNQVDSLNGADAEYILPRPFVWHAGSLTALATLGGQHGQAMAINSKGDIAGYADSRDANYTDKPVIWTQSAEYSPLALSVLSGKATCLLDDGTAAGNVYRAGRTWAAIWKAGKITLLGNANDTASSCNGIRQDGVAVGYCVPAGQNDSTPYIEGNRNAVMWKAGRHVMLPGFGGQSSECSAVNESGVVVGWADSKDGRRACKWKPSGFEPLPTIKGVDEFKT